MKVVIEPNANGKYTAYVGGVMLGDKYSSASKACKKVTKYLEGQNR